MANSEIVAEENPTLGGGSFFGAVRWRREEFNAIFTDLQHFAPRKLPAHAHELPFFALLLGGSYGERYRHRHKQFGPFTLMYRPAGIPHQDEIGPQGVRFFEIEIRGSWRQRIEQCSGSLDQPHEERGGGELVWIAMRLFRETRSGSAPGDLAVESLLAELVAEAARLPHERLKEAPSWLSRILDKLRTEYCERLTLDELSREAGVHSVHLSRVFRKCRGEGIGDFVHRLRIREACEQMLCRERSLADISFATGFADQSHFTRAFRRITGMSPATLRRIVVSG